MSLGFWVFEGGKRALKGTLNTSPGLFLYALVILILGLLTQLGVLWALRRDGSVMGYAVLTLVMALGHFFLTKAWKRQGR